MHGPPAGPNAPLSQVQLVNDELPAGELEFDGQAMHIELAEAPTAVEYVPAPHSVHAADPVAVLYFPAAHVAQLPPAGPENPALHVQLVEAKLPTDELELDGQVVQAADPVDALYFAATHAVHGPPSGPE
jgi:hypothetical protein